ncbi:MAG: cytochrome P450 [Cyanobacteria bacterium P01_F01_bin.53]
MLLGIPVEGHVASPERPALDVEKVYQTTAVISYRFLRVVTGEKMWKKYLPLKSSREYWSARHYIEDFLTPYVDAALQQRDQPCSENGTDKEADSGTPSMLTKIAAKESRYTRETLLSESLEILIAGTDTTAHSLSFAVGELTLNTRVLNKARSIVDEAWAKHGEFSLNTLKDLTYIRAIVKETLRLYSVASGSTSLETTRPTTIEGMTLPIGTKISWSMQAAGREPKIYPNPTEFMPERWLDGTKESPSVPMIDFGSGLHRCLGEHLAMLEATMMLAQLLHNFEWELVNGRASLEKLQQNLLIYPADGMPVRLKARRRPSENIAV